MLELTFSDAAAALLESDGIARRFSPLKHSDIACLMLMLDVDSLQDAGAMQGQRDALLERYYGVYEGVPEAFAANNRNTMVRLETARAKHEPVRVWVMADHPADQCGLRWLCAYLGEDWAGSLTVVSVPTALTEDTLFLEYKALGELETYLVPALLKRGEWLDEHHRARYRREWQQLVQEDAPLRAVINGRLLSVDAAFYDPWIRSEEPAGTFPVALWMGRVLGKLPGLNDRWLYARLTAYMGARGYREVQPAGKDGPYSAVVTKQGY